ncbi:g11394 [Coccomyxa elongata]
MAEEEAVDYTEAEAEAEAEAPEAADAPAAADSVEEATAANGGPQEGAANGAAETNGEKSSDDPMSEPPHGTEVFVGGIPRTASEDQLKVFAEAVGEVHAVVLLKDPQNNEQNRGFGFVKFKTRAAAADALEKLAGKQMADFPGQNIRVAPSQSKHKLYLGNIPRDLSKEGLKEQLDAIVKGVEAIDLLSSKDYPGQNRGFAFVEFYNHACAQLAKNTLSAPTYTMGGRTLNVAYAEPKGGDQVPAQQVKSVYVGNLPASATELKLKELFEQFGEVTKVVIPPSRPDKPNREFGFVHFNDRSVVEKLVQDSEKGTKPSLDGSTLEVKMAKPQLQLDQQQQQGFGGGRGGFGGRGGGFGGPLGGRHAGGRGGFQARGRGRGGFGGRGGGYSDYGYGGYDEGYGADYGYGNEGYGAEGYGGYGGGGYDEGYGSAAGFGAMAAGGAMPAMVPMMLPNGQIGYVIQGGAAATGAAGAGAGGFGGTSPGGPIRSGSGYGGRGGRGGMSGPPRGRGGPRGGGGYGGGGGRRYQPY